MATAIDLTVPTHVRPHMVATVEHRASWADAWTEIENVVVDAVSFAAGSDFGQADMRFDFGMLKPPGGAAYAQVDPLDIDRHWVRITFRSEAEPTAPVTLADMTVEEIAELSVEEIAELDAVDEHRVVWVGIVTNQAKAFQGTNEHTYNGTQKLTAVTIEWVLSRIQVTKSRVSGSLGGGDEWIIERAIAFNAGVDSGQSNAVSGYQGNMLFQKVVPESYCFPELLFNAIPWNTGTIFEYLLRWVEFEAGGPTITVSASSLSSLSWFQVGEVKTEGRTLLQIFDQICGPRYGLIYNIEYSPEQDTFILQSHTFTDVPISLGDGGNEIPANSETITLDLDAGQDTGQFVTTVDSSRQYERVTAMGARVGIVFTLNVSDLDPNWSADDEQAYRDGANGVAGYAGWTREKQETENDKVRQQEHLKRVYTSFKLPDDWDGTDWNGVSVYETDEKWWTHGIRFKPWLPLLESMDYTQLPPAPLTTKSNANYRKAFAICDVAATGGTAYIDVSKTGTASNSENVLVLANRFNGFDFACSLVMEDGCAGFRIIPSGPSHLIAGVSRWSGIAKEPSSVRDQMDYEKMLVTVFMERDTHVKMTAHADPEVPVNDMLSELVIRVGDRARLDWLQGFSMVAIDEDGSYKTCDIDNISLRDDRDILRDIAYAAYEWHKKPRTSVAITLRQITALLKIGQFVTDIGGTTGGNDNTLAVNSLITGIHWDLSNGITRVRTQFADQFDVTETVASGRIRWKPTRARLGARA